MAAGVIPPITLNFLRWAIAVIFLLPFVWGQLKNDWPLVKKHLGLMSATAFLSITTYNALQYLALTTSSAINVALITSAGPIFTILVGRAFFKAGISTAASVGALISVLGVAWVLIRGDIANAAGIRFVPGDLFMLLAVALWSVYTWLLRNRPQAMSIYSALTSQIILGLVFALPMVIAELYWGNYPPLIFTPKVFAILLYVAICPALLAYICWQQAVARSGSELPMFFQNLTPVFAGLMSVTLLGEFPESYQFVGLVFIVIGIVLANRNRK